MIPTLCGAMLLLGPTINFIHYTAMQEQSSATEWRATLLQMLDLGKYFFQYSEEPLYVLAVNSRWTVSLYAAACLAILQKLQKLCYRNADLFLPRNVVGLSHRRFVDYL